MWSPCLLSPTSCSSRAFSLLLALRMSCKARQLAVRVPAPLREPALLLRYPLLRATSSLTLSAGIIHQYDLLQQDGRAGVQDTVHCSQQRGPGLVVKHNDDAGSGQWRAAPKLLVDTSGRMKVDIELSRSLRVPGEGGLCAQITITTHCSLEPPAYVLCYSWE